MRMFVDLNSVYLYRDPVDFRKAINGLSLIVEQQMLLSPFDDALFLFCNRQRDKVKVLYWDKTGFCLWCKRLENDAFKWPYKSDDTVMNLTVDQWQGLLLGFDGFKFEGHLPVEYLICVE